MSFVSHYLLREPVLSLLLIFFLHTAKAATFCKRPMKHTTSRRNVLLFSSLEVPGQELLGLVYGSPLTLTAHAFLSVRDKHAPVAFFLCEGTTHLLRTGHHDLRL